MRILFHILMLTLLCSCGSTVVQNNATINFDNVQNDFGSVQYKKVAEHSFQFENSGNTMLIINDVKTSCGCTVPEWPKEPIKPGKKAFIKVKYDASFPGVFHKSIEVFYNGSESPMNLEIKGTVEYPEGSEK